MRWTRRRGAKTAILAVEIAAGAAVLTTLLVSGGLLWIISAFDDEEHWG